MFGKKKKNCNECPVEEPVNRVGYIINGSSSFISKDEMKTQINNFRRSVLHIRCVQEKDYNNSLEVDYCCDGHHFFLKEATRLKDIFKNCPYKSEFYMLTFRNAEEIDSILSKSIIPKEKLVKMFKVLEQKSMELHKSNNTYGFLKNSKLGELPCNVISNSKIDNNNNNRSIVIVKPMAKQNLCNRFRLLDGLYYEPESSTMLSIVLTLALRQPWFVPCETLVDHTVLDDLVHANEVLDSFLNLDSEAIKNAEASFKMKLVSPKKK